MSGMPPEAIAAIIVLLVASAAGRAVSRWWRTRSDGDAEDDKEEDHPQPEDEGEPDYQPPLLGKEAHAAEAWNYRHREPEIFVYQEPARGPAVHVMIGRNNPYQHAAYPYQHAASLPPQPMPAASAPQQPLLHVPPPATAPPATLAPVVATATVADGANAPPPYVP